MATSTFFLPFWAIMFGSTINVVTCAIQLDLRAMPSVVQPLETKNVTIQCLVSLNVPTYTNQYSNSYYYNNENGKYLPVTYSLSHEGGENGLDTIRILKNFQNKWHAIAHINKIAPTVVHKIDTTINSVDGILSDDLTRRSFIKVTWEVASSDVFGTYRCDVISFDVSQNAILTTSSELALGNTLNAQDFLRLLKHDLTDIRKTVGHQEQFQETNHNLTEQLNFKLKTLQEQTESKQKELDGKISEQGERQNAVLEKLEKRINELEKELTSKIGEVASKANIALDSGFLMLWPRGNYGLLQPDTGCSFGGMTKWESGSVRIHTESTDRNRDELSPETHLQSPALERENGHNFITQHFCVKTDSNSVGPNWPKGSYCINKKENCPRMFNDGLIRWDEEDSVSLHRSNGTLPEMMQNTTYTRMYYCCRQDGPAEVPVYLPESDPFYLYRYGGKCQQVHGMSVSEEFILFDTENTNNRDELQKAHPDGRKNNIILELCYYRRV